MGRRPAADPELMLAAVLLAWSLGCKDSVEARTVVEASGCWGLGASRRFVGQSRRSGWDRAVGLLVEYTCYCKQAVLGQVGSADTLPSACLWHRQLIEPGLGLGLEPEPELEPGLVVEQLVDVAY